MKDMGTAMKLLNGMDLSKLGKLAEKVDLNELVGLVSSLDEASLAALMKMGKARKPKTLPEVNGDFYGLGSTLTESQREVQLQVRAFMEREVEPIINDYWSRDEFPQQLIPKFRELNLISKLYNPDGSRVADAAVLEGIATLEMARIDVSTATFFGVHSGLAMLSILVGGSDEQRAHWLPKMRNMDVVGAFGLTEPHVGSGVAGGLTTTCRRDSDAWVLNGEKYWIGNSTFSDIVIVWARDVADNEVKGFIVETDTPGYSVEKIMGKIALRAVENGHITLTECRVPETHRLQ
ncbi:hypothetical protein BH24DEI2_BH24DEI2_16550 [soil metagenome]